ncbi:hypothetical protein KK120_17035 [Virgibacillus dakarensis]|nr:hypothetical protein [Virgibacillus dakarensis]
MHSIEYLNLKEEVDNINYVLSLNLDFPQKHIDYINLAIQKTENLPIGEENSVELPCISFELLDTYRSLLSNGDFDQINDIYNQIIEKNICHAINEGFTNYLDLYKRANNNESFDNSDLKKIDKRINFYCEKLKNFYEGFEKYEKIHPYKLNGLRIKGYDIEINIKDIIKKLKSLDQGFGEFIQYSLEYGYINLEEGTHQEGFFLELPYSNKIYIYISCTGDLDDFLNTVHEIGHAYHFYISRQLSNKNRNNSTEMKEFLAHSFEAIYLKEFHKELIDIYNIHQISSILWNIVLFKFQENIYNSHVSYYKLDEKNKLFLSLVKNYTHKYLENNSEYDNVLKPLWTYESSLLESPYYNLEYIFSQLNSLKLINKDNITLDYLKKLANSNLKSLISKL